MAAAVDQRNQQGRAIAESAPDATRLTQQTRLATPSAEDVLWRAFKIEHKSIRGKGEYTKKIHSDPSRGKIVQDRLHNANCTEPDERHHAQH